MAVPACYVHYLWSQITNTHKQKQSTAHGHTHYYEIEIKLKWNYCIFLLHLFYMLYNHQAISLPMRICICKTFLLVRLLCWLCSVGLFFRHSWLKCWLTQEMKLFGEDAEQNTGVHSKEDSEVGTQRAPYEEVIDSCPKTSVQRNL